MVLKANLSDSPGQKEHSPGSCAKEQHKSQASSKSAERGQQVSTSAYALFTYQFSVDLLSLCVAPTMAVILSC